MVGWRSPWWVVRGCVAAIEVVLASRSLRRARVYIRNISDVAVY